jgi:hypothetical protein
VGDELTCNYCEIDPAFNGFFSEAETSPAARSR